MGFAWLPTGDLARRGPRGRTAQTGLAVTLQPAWSRSVGTRGAAGKCSSVAWGTPGDVVRAWPCVPSAQSVLWGGRSRDLVFSSSRSVQLTAVSVRGLAGCTSSPHVLLCHGASAIFIHKEVASVSQINATQQIRSVLLKGVSISNVSVL